MQQEPEYKTSERWRCIAAGRRKGRRSYIKELVPLELLEMYAKNVSFFVRKNAVNVSLFHWK
jgi:hypothetical protein